MTETQLRLHTPDPNHVWITELIDEARTPAQLEKLINTYPEHAVTIQLVMWERAAPRRELERRARELGVPTEHVEAAEQHQGRP